MSRTFRRKNYEDTQRSSWDNSGRRTAGFYTQYGLEYEHYLSWEGEPGLIVTIENRAPTREEYYKKFWYNHGDLGANRRGPGKMYRRYRNRENRRINNQELHRWARRDNYEPMCESKARDCWWDWC